MDDFERTTQTVRTDQTIPAAAPQDATAAPPIEPVAAASAAPPAAPTRVVTEAQRTTDRPSSLEMARRIVTLGFGILQSLLILRIVILLLGANRQNDIVSAILTITNPFVAPFRDMFSLDRISAGNGSIFDFGAVVALIAWTLIELLVLAVLNLGSRRRSALA